jgi:hypothetical protein
VSQPHLAEQQACPLVGLAPVDPEDSADLVAEHHVLPDGEVVAEVDLLVHGGHTRVLGVARTGEAHLLPAHLDGAGIDAVHAG